jgi:hypothetical protein
MPQLKSTQGILGVKFESDWGMFSKIEVKGLLHAWGCSNSDRDTVHVRGSEPPPKTNVL